MTGDAPAPRLLDAGDGGLVIELGETIDDRLNATVVALAAAIEALALPGLHEVVPTYRSLLVLFDPLVLPAARLRAIVAALPPPRPASDAERRLWRVPVCYGGACGIDLDDVAARHGLATDEVVRLHAGATYRVHMIGFAPGFAYLGGLPTALHTSRRTDPRPKTPARSVSIGGRQTAVSSPLEVPSGWHLIGRTPVRSYDPHRTSQPFLFSAGDAIRFEPIDGATYERLCRAAEAGEIVAEREMMP
ncbi:5-oxoprolinase subunit PxpB [Siculibacillus lacustris]|uniref:5-oxoprolinase subunit PxpB n=1 Tax=Siculibacillus lacustris TaxID=1549641 RepID=A0A4V2KT17_9HYPH|nr:5-oxoprolinase subunit PxpB [Siculibacillus lacustris]TBW35356.1 5-oxoprolinase subunit PxpB [Siculibacillus lacustris]